MPNSHPDASRRTSPSRCGLGRRAVAWLALIPWLAGTLLSQCSAAIRLTDVTVASKIPFRHVDGSSGRYNIPECVSAGLALFDYDGDGDEDIYFLNGGALEGTDYAAPPTNALYRNDGDWRFTDVTAASGLGDPQHGLAVACADYDNDGDQDVYLSNFGPNALYRNEGDGTFVNVTEAAGVVGSDRVGAGVCFLDADADGDLDLFVSDYLVFRYNAVAPRKTNGFPIYPGPKSHPPASNFLYRNNGDGTFTDISQQAGIAGHSAYGMGTVCLDYDFDHDTDIVVANDETGNFLFRNDGKGRFEEVGLLCGLGFDSWGAEMGNMGVTCGDYNRDGHMDLYMTSYEDEYTVLYENTGSGFFEDVTMKTGAAVGTFAPVSWGAGMVDLDNDGWLDIFVACGHLQDNAERCEEGSTYHTPNILFRGLGEGKFANISAEAGDGLKASFSSRGAAFDDLDADGDLDVVILNSRQGPTLLRNDSTDQGHWLQVALRGTTTNRDGVGARVQVSAGRLVLIDEVHSGCGYQSHYGTRLHFGLGPERRVDRIEVSWIGGGTQVFENIEADQRLLLVEGEDRPRTRSSVDR